MSNTRKEENITKAESVLNIIRKGLVWVVQTAGRFSALCVYLRQLNLVAAIKQVRLFCSICSVHQNLQVNCVGCETQYDATVIITI